MTSRDALLIRGALIRAIEWETSLAECWAKDTPEHVAAKDKAAEFRTLLHKLGGREPQISGDSVSIYEIAKRA